MKTPGEFRVAEADYGRDFDALRAVREAVFIREQGVPVALELDEADARCVHVVARDAEGNAIGTGRLVPPDESTAGDGHGAGPGLPAARIGRMAVLADWRGRGVGDALLAALLEGARGRGWHRVMLHAQATAIRFYQRHGFLPLGPRFMEAGIEHLTMWRHLDGTMAVTEAIEAVAVVVALAHSARRELRIRTRDLDPGVFDTPAVLEALRRFATSRRGATVQVLLRDAAGPQRNHAPLLPLAQRLPSVFAFREADDRIDTADPSAFVVDDQAGSWYRAFDNRLDGHARLASPGHARQLRERFDRAWERARPATEYRVLGA
ncbi:MAG TPA: GNAT family N-acetyltransferase [Xanthomonadaceae bacterium]|nr:GNAT family N-acetyltransferase [Xanthomonadaceae bacterium]